MERKVKLSRRGDAQVVRIPKGFELPGDTVLVRKVGNAIWLEAEPTRPKQNLLDLLREMEPIDEEWPEIEDRPPEPVELQE
ncbi:MAG: AbrB/MazE/SpoVT family DNA-binding domain-containing protein [Hyphomicrobiaceae bacterium]|nr:AbrB/MazE/SpoVT family DNA-binding domain-containing protein [Hyphomicrobiaceae bacterium]